MSSYSNLQLGQTITIGKYYKYANDLNTKELIDWIVLDIDTNAKKALVVSKYALECGPYHDMPEDITWEDSDIRAWLNNEFLQTAFSKDEQKRICLSHIKNSNNPESNTLGGNDTDDKVFLLSIEEAQTYFKDDDARRCTPNEYCFTCTGYEEDVKNYGLWYLRSPGYEQDTAATVYPSGFIAIRAANQNFEDALIRPAMWTSINED